jgi:hypothetical protein
MIKTANILITITEQNITEICTTYLKGNASCKYIYYTNDASHLSMGYSSMVKSQPCKIITLLHMNHIR